jgi:hypothetical protein
LIRTRIRAFPATMLAVAAWLAVAFGLWTLGGGQT